MGRKKQANPHQSHRSTPECKASTSASAEPKERVFIDKPFYVKLHKNSWVSDDHRYDISELVLTHLSSIGGELDHICSNSNYSFRFRLCNVNHSVDRIKLGHYPLLSYSDVSLELIDKEDSVILSGIFDGPDEGVTALVHLASLDFLTLRPVSVQEGMSSFRVRVELLKNIFDACESIFDNSRQLWRKSMMNVMAWLRPEVTTSEVKYGLPTSMDETQDVEGRKFDVGLFYEAIKPSKDDPVLEDDIPDLLPVLRPYQRRAVYWMVQREKGSSGFFDKRNNFSSPLMINVSLLDSCSKMFYNPFSGSVALEPEYSPCIYGGILADEMGLGKTVELLACIFVHRKPVCEDSMFDDNASLVCLDKNISMQRLKTDRIECVCGAVSESRKYRGLWVQCDICDAWQHAECVGYSPKGKSLKARNCFNGGGHQQKKRKKDTTEIDIREGEYICKTCSELLQATRSPIPTGATLIVCPAPILPQWHAEITRHTRPNSLKTCVYEGVKYSSVSKACLVDINQLVTADVVLTTYDVLKEDLSHDSDRHNGDRRYLRFQKRYPVIPTLLTRIFWWRVCLDEAQMVESNVAAATDMALRLHAKYRWCISGTPIQRKMDDLYGLLRFLKASPFNVFRWWTEVMREPYERNDAGAVDFTHNLFRQIMWRSSKVHVADELQLPAQEECVSWLTFSPIEKHFYQRQHETCVSDACEVIKSLKDDMLKRELPDSLVDHFICHEEAAKLLNSLLKLRQACCHPQVGNSGLRSLRSLQQAPMTMEEILMVLVSKTKIEGEEALRVLVVALNGLAALAIINQEFSQAATLYKEALDISKKHSEDFRLDPLLNIHILHNLAEILPRLKNCPEPLPMEMQVHSRGIEKVVQPWEDDKEDDDDVERARISPIDNSNFTINGKTSQDRASNVSEIHSAKNTDYDYGDQSLKLAYEKLESKYLLGFRTKLNATQQEFQKSYMQVSNTLSYCRKQHTVWWLEALHHAEQNQEFFHDLTRKVDEAISESRNNSSSSKVSSRFRTVNGLKYHLKTSIDQLEAARKALVDRIQEIDQKMKEPSEEDLECVRNSRCCQNIDGGPSCRHCELGELFQDYEARLFLIQHHDGGSASAEEAINLQKKSSALNRFFGNLSSPHSETITSEEFKRSNAAKKVVASRSPSQLEVVLGVIKGYCKAHLGREENLVASKELELLKGMRKEFVHARSLATAQEQFLRAYDEVKMATTRLHLSEIVGDKSICALSRDKLDAANVELSSDKFTALTSLSSIKGKLRYLQGLMKSNKKQEVESLENSLLSKGTASMEQNSECQRKPEEACPICQEKLSNQKVVFQCGHVTCCKCLFLMTEKNLLCDPPRKWVMCPICRQHTDLTNIGYVEDRQYKQLNSSTDQSFEEREVSLTVQGSYGTKIEAVTRRILSIKSNDPEAKVLVFSSWNDVLGVLAHAFSANDITFVRMKGGRKAQVAINKFREQKSNKSIQVLLLLIQHGANGLNLLEAQHVILVEPLLNPAAEAQAVGRVHRIGQEKKTLVHRFIVRDTVEESVFKLNKSRNSSSFLSGNTKNQDQPFFTLKDIESLFAPVPSVIEIDQNSRDNLRDLPPSSAAVRAAEMRLQQNAPGSDS